jgi:flagellar biosynthetic protein FlhB
MAENDSSQERTEDPTPRRLQQAKEKGQVPRSKELGTAAVLIAAAAGMIILGKSLALALHNIMIRQFSLTRTEALDYHTGLAAMGSILGQLAVPLGLFLALLFIAAFIASIILGGLTISAEAATPKLSKMSLFKGFKRMFGIQAAVELFKAIAKFAVIAAVAIFLLSIQFDSILHLSAESFPGNIAHAMQILSFMFILLCCSLILIVIIDVPYQIWNHKRQLKMTQQEIRDEMKDTEGKPEVKGRIRQLQREMAQRRMMGNVPDADVVVTNPSHYSVALKYDPAQPGAPKVVAKGIEEVAMKIREIARESDIPMITSPALTRAIYYTTKLDDEIPDELFIAVAQVLAYVFQMREYKKGKAQRPKPLPNELPIPEGLKY